MKSRGPRNNCGSTARSFIHCRGTAAGLVFYLCIRVEVCAAIYDLYMLKSSSEQSGTVVFHLDSTTYAADVGGHATCDGFRQLSFERNVTDRKAASWFEDTANLAEHGGLIRREVQNAI